MAKRKRQEQDDTTTKSTGGSMHYRTHGAISRKQLKFWASTAKTADARAHYIRALINGTHTRQGRAVQASGAGK